MNDQEQNCLFCFSILFSNIKIEYGIHPIIITKCFQGHQKEIDLSLFFDFNNKSYDNNKLKAECPLCKEFLDKDVFFLCLETGQLICPKCIALNIIISSSKNSKKNKPKKGAKSSKKSSPLPQPHYSTLISLLKESTEKTNEKMNIEDYFNNDKIVECDINVKNFYMKYKEIIIDEKEKRYLNRLYDFANNINNVKKRICEIYKENKNYLSKYFFENVKYIKSSYDNIDNIFLSNFAINNKNNSLYSKDLISDIKFLDNYYQNIIKKQNNIFVNKISMLSKKDNKNNIINNNWINCIYQQDSIISYILYFTYESEQNEKEKQKEKFLIVSSNNGIMNILDINNYKTLYTLDIFQNKGIYHLIQSEKEKNIFYASSWGCFKKIKLSIEKGSNTQTFKHNILKTYKKSDIIRILQLIEIKKNIISLDEGGHIISWGYDEEFKKDTKEEIFVSDREDSINNMILFISNKLRNMLIFSTRKSTSLGCIHFYNIEDGFYELKCLKNKFKSNQISFDLQYHTLTQINDFMIVFPQNKNLNVVDVKTCQIVTVIEMQIDLIKDKFYNCYGETIKIINLMDEENKSFLIFSSKGFVFQYKIIEENNNNEIFYIGKYKFDELKEEIENILYIDNNKNIYKKDMNENKLYLKLNKKILFIDFTKNKK